MAEYQLPTDIVYTAKTFYAVQQMIASNTIKEGSNVLMIHSGGLQGNLSLPANTLCFDSNIDLCWQTIFIKNVENISGSFNNNFIQQGEIPKSAS